MPWPSGLFLWNGWSGSWARPRERNRIKADPGTVHYLGTIPEHGHRVLRVVINRQVSPVRVVTVFFDRKMKGQL
jgi:hypothetical protein